MSSTPPPDPDRPARMDDSEINRFLVEHRTDLDTQRGSETPVPDDQRVPDVLLGAVKPIAHRESQKTKSPSPLDLMVSVDGLQVHAKAILPETQLDDVQGALKHLGIVADMLENEVCGAIQKAQKTGKPVQNVLVCSGIPARPAASPRLVYHLPKDITHIPDLQKIDDFKTMTEPEAVIAAAESLVIAWWVSAGDVLAVKVSPSGISGIDVYGNPLPPPEADGLVSASFPGVGTGVVLQENDSQYCAQVCGYAGLLDGQVTVLPAVWVPSDVMAAYFIKLPWQFGAVLSAKDVLKDMLNQAGVVYGVLDPVLQKLVTMTRDGALDGVLFLVAQGQAPQAPPVVEPTLYFAHEPQIGAVQADGSIDFKEQHRFPSAHKDALLAEYDAPDTGVAGTDVYGQVVAAPPVKTVTFVAGEGVRVVGETAQKAYAEREGGAHVKIVHQPSETGGCDVYTFSVRPLLHIASDVGYETGHIDFVGNIDISGSVTRGFRVVATGDVSVRGMVEADTEVRSDCCITVSQGIVGAKTRVVAKGSVTTKFIQDATVEAKGNVVVGSYIHNASVRSDGRIIVAGRGGRGGGIVGGQTIGVQGVAAKNIGSERSHDTVVITGVDLTRLAQLQDLAQKILQAKEFYDRLLNHIGVTSLTSAELQRKVAHNPEQKQDIVSAVKKANQLARLQETWTDQQATLKQQIDHVARQATVDVLDTAYARVLVRIGHHQLRVKDDLRRVRFFWHVREDRIDMGSFG